MNTDLQNSMRAETDGLGPINVPTTAYWGPSTQRAKNNFAISNQTIGGMRSLVWALGAIKASAAQANAKLDLISAATSHVIQQAAEEVMDGLFDAHFIVDPVQGGAGTSTNMNANEVIANRATELRRAQDSHAPAVCPLDDVNRSQSTNDVYPTAVKIALINDLRDLQDECRRLAEAFGDKAEEFTEIVKIGRTQLQDAVPMTLGQEFRAFANSLYQEATSINSLVTQLERTNLGGTAIGTGITVLPGYREAVLRELNHRCDLKLESAPDLVSATSDATPFLTTSAGLRRAAVKLSKIANDLRLLASGPQSGLGELLLPAVQPGSSIMPGKVNPVIPEMVNQVAFHVIGTDSSITFAVEAGQLQLNAFEPIMAHGLLESISWLTRACETFRTHCVLGIQANHAVLEQRTQESVSTITALTPVIGYKAAADLAQEALNAGGNVSEMVLARGLLTPQQLDELLSVTNLTGSRDHHLLTRTSH